MVNDGTKPETFKELPCVIRHLLDTKIFGLKLDPTQNASKLWEIVCLRNGNYIGNSVHRRSVSGFTLYLLDILVSWQSKAQRSMMLSSSDTKSVASLKAVKQNMFMIQLLERMKASVKLPGMVRVNNVRAKFMACNITTKSCTEYIDIRCKYINECVRDQSKIFLLI